MKFYGRWYDYSKGRDAMFAATDTARAPWHPAHSDNRKRVRLNVISRLLSQIPHQSPGYHCAGPQDADGFVEPNRPVRYIPTPLLVAPGEAQRRSAGRGSPRRAPGADGYLKLRWTSLVG